MATTKNVKWVSQGSFAQTYGNPVITTGKVFVGTNNATPRDPKFKDNRSCVYALNEYNGDYLGSWPYRNWPAAR